MFTPIFEYKKKNFIKHVFSTVLSITLHIFIQVCFGINIYKAFINYVLYQSFGLSLLLNIFTLSHTTEDIYLGNKELVIASIEHSVNIKEHWFINFWMGYLNFQIEHHLFPSIPQYKLPEISKKYIKPFCKKHKLIYKEKTFFQAMFDVYLNLLNVSN